MKKIMILFCLTGLLSFAKEYRNGIYRGVFVSGQETQVEVQFRLKDNKVESPRYRTLFYKGQNYLKNNELEKEKDKYQAVLDWIKGKDIDEGLEGLYKPEEIEKAGATVRATKVRAAMQNAINSGVYKPE